MNANDTSTQGAPSGFSPDELLRYSRHFVLPEFGADGQQALKNARILIVGAGGLGSPTALYLAAAGVGTIGLVDSDRVDASNLQRQVLYDTTSIGKSKLEEARARITALNPHTQVVLFDTFLSSANAIEILGTFDVVIDGTDNFATRYLVNDACALLGIPNVYGSIFRFDGQASVFDAQRGPCYRCLYAEPPEPGTVPSCAEGGVLGVLPGIIGVIQATEAIKLVTGIGEPLIGRLMLYDALGMRFTELKIKKNPECPLCGEHPSIHMLIDYDEFCGVKKTPAPAAFEDNAEEISIDDFRALRNAGSDFDLIDVREEYEEQICTLGGRLMPMRQIPDRMEELDRSRPIIVYCHHGFRSLRAVQFLRAQGFTRARSLAGGIDAWGRKYDPGMPRY